MALVEASAEIQAKSPAVKEQTRSMFIQLLRRLIRKGTPARRIFALVLMTVAMNLVFGTSFYLAEHEG